MKVVFVLVSVALLCFSKFVSTCDDPYDDLTTQAYLRSQVPIQDEQFDFIIVGNSPAGSVLANRLSENSRWRVLMVQAGRVPSMFYDIPAAAQMASTSSYHSKTFFTPTNTRSCRGMKNKQCKLFFGSDIGDGAGFNYQVYTRGNEVDYENWGSAVESYRWDNEEILKYFKKAEHSTLNPQFEDRYFHGHTGPLYVENLPYQSSIRDIFLISAKQAGLRTNDYNGHSPFGFSPVQATSRKGKRHSAFRAYIEPIVLTRRNLKIVTETEVERLIFRRNSRNVIGVEFSFRNNLYKAFSKKEVILSAGAFGSPKILLQSGIGAGNNRNQGIDRGVGQSLYDQVLFPGLILAFNKSTLAPLVDADVTVSDFENFINGNGKLTVPGGFETIGLISTRTDRTGTRNRPNIQILQDTGSNKLWFNEPLMQRYFNIPPSSIQAAMDLTGNEYFVNLFVTLLHPKSRGSVKLHAGSLVVDPKYLHEDEDVDDLVRGIQIVQRLLDTPAMAQYGARIVPLVTADCPATLRFNSDQYWKCLVRSLGTSAGSYGGSCRMGRRHDEHAVVGSTFRVHGTTCLRVVDSSVIPITMSGNNNIVEFMMGERAAVIIREKYENSSREEGIVFDGAEGAGHEDESEEEDD